MRTSKILLLVLGMICSLNVAGQVLSLDSVLSRIEKNNAMLKMYDEQASAVGNFSQMAKSWMPPKMTTGPWQIPYKNFREGMWMITGEQMIPNPAKQKASFNSMQAMAPVEQAGKASRRNEMFAMAKSIYYEWIVLKKKSEALSHIDSVLSYVVEAAQRRYAFSKEKLSTIYKARAELYELRNMEAMVAGDIAMKNAELCTLMNCEVSFVFDVDTSVQLHDYERLSADTSLLSTVRSDVRQFDASMNAVKLQQQYERSKRLPDFGVSLSHMQSLGMMPNQYSAMGMIVVPIASWSSKEYKSAIRGLDNTANAIRYQKQSLLIESAGKIRALQIRMKSTREQLANYNENIIPAYDNAYKTGLIAYEQNSEDLFSVLDALKMYRMAKMNEFDLLTTQLNLQVDYEKEMEIR